MAEHTEQQQTPSPEERKSPAESHPVELRSDEVVERAQAPVTHVYSTPVPVVTASKKDTAQPEPKEEQPPHSEFSYLFNDEEGDPYDILMEQRKHGETYSGRRLGDALPVKESSSASESPAESPALLEEEEEDMPVKKSRFSVKQWLQSLFSGRSYEEDEETPTTESEPETEPETETDITTQPANDATDLSNLAASDAAEPADESEASPAEAPAAEEPTEPPMEEISSFTVPEVPAEEVAEEPSSPMEEIFSSSASDELPSPAEEMTEELPAEEATESLLLSEEASSPEEEAIPLTPADVCFPPVGDMATQELEQMTDLSLPTEEEPAAEEPQPPEEPAVEEPPVPETSPFRVEGVTVYNEETGDSRLVYDMEVLPALPVAAEGSMTDLIAWEYEQSKARAPRLVELTDTLSSLELPPEATETPSDTPGKEKPTGNFWTTCTSLLKQGAGLFLIGINKMVSDPQKKEGEEEIDENGFREYEPDSDVDAVRKDMAALGKQLRLRLYLLTGLFGITLLLAITNSLPAALPAFFKAGANSFPYVFFHTVCLLVAMLCSINTLKNGWSGILTLRGESDGAISFASGICAFYMLYLMLNGRAVSQGAFVPVSAVILGLLLNTYGKYLIMKRTRNNFRFVTSSEDKYVLKLAEKDLGQAALSQIQKEDVRPVYRRKTAFLRQFLRLSYAFDESEQTSQKWMVPGIIFTAVATLLSLIFSRDIVQGMMTLSLAACISVPVTNMLSVNLPVAQTAESLLRSGAMLSGYAAAESLADANYVVLRDTDLFPNHSVVFCMLRAFGYDRIDEAILDAAALIAETKGPMKDMFENILREKAQELPRVESVHYEEGEGLVGWVHGSRVLVGNEKLLEKHGISAPSKDYTAKYADGNRSITYLAVSGELVAMFVTEYTANHTVTEQLSKAVKAGLRLLVQTHDCNITKDLITRRFGISASAVDLLPQSQMAAWEKLQQETDGEEASLAVSGKLSSLLQATLSCRKLKNTATLAVLLQNVGLLLGMLLVLFLAVTSGIRVMGTLYLLIFQAFWILAVLAVPLLRRFFNK